jgi:hypothetical protein
MAAVRQRWLSGRAVSLHVAVLVLVPGCAIAAWWQIGRAQDGNPLSYLYSVMWPVFGVLAVYFWWMLLHTDYDDVGLKGMRRRQAQRPTVDGADAVHAAVHARPLPHPDEDPELAAYNDRLAELSAKGPQTWRHREAPVARRAQ